MSNPTVNQDIILEQTKQLLDSFQNKVSIPLTINSKKSDIQTIFPEPIKLQANRNYEAALIWFSAYNTIFNVDNSNNKFYYSKNGGTVWLTITLTNGAYEIRQLNSEIQRIMKANNDWNSTDNAYYISISVNLSNSKSVLMISNPAYKVDFTKPNNVGTLLGFNPQILSTGYNVSNNIVQITNLSTINIECDLVEGSYFNGKKGSIMHSFPAYTVPVGYKIVERITVPIYLPVSLKTISRIRTRIIDENSKLINFNGEEISLYIHIRQI